jgi:hypothetical protein
MLPPRLYVSAPRFTGNGPNRESATRNSARLVTAPKRRQAPAQPVFILELAVRCAIITKNMTPVHLAQGAGKLISGTSIGKPATQFAKIKRKSLKN